MMVLLIITILLTIGYGWLIFYYHRAWAQVPIFTPRNSTPETRITIVIPARNEEKNIGSVLDCMDRQEFPKWLFNVIVIDDHSTDATAALIREYYPNSAKVLLAEGKAVNSHKKKALETGINAAKGDLIVTTDADCSMGRKWLGTIEEFKRETEAILIAAPVRLQHNNSLLQVFQSLDFMVLQGITAAAVHTGTHSMANGANLAYEKKAFVEVNGFSGIDQIASGDDMLLVHKIKQKHPGRIHYLKSKEAIVTSQPMKTWKEFFNQRIRWASKTFYYKDRSLLAVLLLVYLYNLSFLALFIAGFFDYECWLVLAAAWIVKTIIEWPFVSSVARFYEKTALMKYFFFFQPIHIVYTILAGWFGQLGKYEWKGRKVR